MVTFVKNVTALTPEQIEGKMMNFTVKMFDFVLKMTILQTGALGAIFD